MCLGAVGRVSTVAADGTLIVEADSRASTVSALLLDRPAAAGDWVLVHAGYALHLLSETEAHDLLAARTEVRP